jgi:hypothetical protein
VLRKRHFKPCTRLINELLLITVLDVPTADNVRVTAIVLTLTKYY